MKTKIVYIILFLLINIQIVYSKLQEIDKKDFSLDELNKYNNIKNNHYLLFIIDRISFIKMIIIHFSQDFILIFFQFINLHQFIIFLFSS